MQSLQPDKRPSCLTVHAMVPCWRAPEASCGVNSRGERLQLHSRVLRKAYTQCLQHSAKACSGAHLTTQGLVVHMHLPCAASAPGLTSAILLIWAIQGCNFSTQEAAATPQAGASRECKVCSTSLLSASACPICCAAELQEFCEEHGYNCRLEATGTLFIPPDYNVSVTDWERSLRLRWARPAAAVAAAELSGVVLAQLPS